GCGYGCQIHHVVYCFIVAYGTKRTLILKSRGWRYNKAGWEDVFQPISNSCTDPSGYTHSHWPGINETQVVDLPIIDTLSQRPPYLPLAIPQDISEQLIRLHGDPAAWWAGQFLKYMLKPQLKTQEMLDSLSEQLGFQRPIVGLCQASRGVRREARSAQHTLKSPESNLASLPSVFKTTQAAAASAYGTKYGTSTRTKMQHHCLGMPSIGDSDLLRMTKILSRYVNKVLEAEQSQGMVQDIKFLPVTMHLMGSQYQPLITILYQGGSKLIPNPANHFESFGYQIKQKPDSQRTQFS
ncbi:unnamed protein product, partial [Meganyctiphanes norvegica]